MINLMRLSIIILLMQILSCHRTGGLIYRDGTYKGESQSIYTAESYYGITTIVVKNDVITSVQFTVLDKAKNEIFDEKYENHYKDIPEYIRQCRNDWQGVRTYPGRLLKVQDINKVDAITGATWSYNLFRASLLAALAEARIQ
jgi:major membrane immunogen (membrane-anchored lipoprotein)